jgi:hypothetical protein
MSTGLAAAARQVIEASTALDCGCSVLERDSGHRVGCSVPVLREALDGMGEALKNEARADGDLLDKALRFDMDHAAIEQREREAVELVELRSDKAQLLAAAAEGMAAIIALVEKHPEITTWAEWDACSKFVHGHSALVTRCTRAAEDAAAKRSRSRP